MAAGPHADRTHVNDHRLNQLRALIDRLERLPTSPNRDWMLREVRARAVDVEIGVRPAPIRPLDPDDPLADPDAGRVAAPKQRDMSPSRRTPSRRAEAPAAEHARTTAPAPSDVVVEPPVIAPPRAPVAERGDRLDLLETGGVISLDDLPTEPPEDARAAASPPWAYGLRG
jgi:hypothetical protein